MEWTFYKYQGTGNDFIMIDNRNLKFPQKDASLVQNMCDRRFGIGADGLILLNPSDQWDFKMVYFNADGKEGSMCGNGGRCLVAFAKKRGIISDKTTFEAIDGLHHAIVEDEMIKLQMIEVSEIKIEPNHVFLDTGSPHHVQLVADIADYDVFSNGRKIRNGSPYFQTGTNVNFVEPLGTNTFRVRTYERGVEAETLACGTGVTAVAIAMHAQNLTQSNKVNLKVEGGTLEVSFDREDDGYRNVFLKGPATFVFKGCYRSNA